MGWRAGLVVVVALVGAALVTAVGADAQDGPSCKGQVATVGGTLVPGGVPTFTGTPDDDVIVGTSGADLILGKGGNDLICGRGGPDEIRGGGGRDRIYAGGGADTVYGGKNADVIVGGPGPDLLIGNGGADTIRGKKGDDVIRGRAGPDMLWGNAGDDTIRGNKGIDECRGGTGADTVTSCNEAAENCHPSYSGCLKADSPDYDCAGGGGNGPDYTGEVKVIGPDVFDLDADGDGVACEID